MRKFKDPMFTNYMVSLQAEGLEPTVWLQRERHKTRTNEVKRFIRPKEKTDYIHQVLDVLKVLG